MKLDINDIPGMPLAELREAEIRIGEDAELYYPMIALKTDLSKRAESERYYQGLIEIRNRLREEISRRVKLIDNLSDLTVLELKELQTQYYEETDYWHEEFIKTETDGGKYSKYEDEARQTRKKIAEEIAGRMNFLDSLPELTMAELVLTEARHQRESREFERECQANADAPDVSEKYRKKNAVSLEARDMVRAEIARRTGQSFQES